ncbi:MAG: hypothetical protein ACP5G3_04060 [Sulfurihydrogenibium sp.]|uniref:hypothetical protein n=1 Tax=Sulfurihydrogenibium sp. TaxID=2053621 RepID=UPI003D0A6773
MKKNSLILIAVLTILSFHDFSFAKDSKYKQSKNTSQEITVPVEKKVNEKEFSKTNTVKKQKKEIEVEVK